MTMSEQNIKLHKILCERYLIDHDPINIIQSIYICKQLYFLVVSMHVEGQLSENFQTFLIPHWN